MAEIAKHRGHDIEAYNNEKWLFSDSRKLVSENININCGNCGEESTVEGHDGCLGTIPNIMNACCGHGVESECYVQFLNGRCISGKEAIIYLRDKI